MAPLVPYPHKKLKHQAVCVRLTIDVGAGGTLRDTALRQLSDPAGASAEAASASSSGAGP